MTRTTKTPSSQTSTTKKAASSKNSARTSGKSNPKEAKKTSTTRKVGKTKGETTKSARSTGRTLKGSLDTLNAPKVAKKAAPKKATAKKAAPQNAAPNKGATKKVPKKTAGKKAIAKVPHKRKKAAPESTAMSEMAAAMMNEMGAEDMALEREAALENKRQDLMERLAVAQNRFDDMPNQELAAHLVFHLDTEGVGLLLGLIETRDEIHSPDAARVIHEVGSRDLELVMPYADRFVALCTEDNLDLLPFVMYAMAPLGPMIADQLWDTRDLFWQAITGTDDYSEMAQVGAVRLLSALCASGPSCARTLAGGLVDLLGKCPPNEVAVYAECVLPALGSAHSHRAKPVLDRRMKELTPAEVARLRRAVRSAQAAPYSYAA